MRITIDLRLLGRGGRSGIEEYTINLVSEMLKVGRHNFNFFYNGFRMAQLPEELFSQAEILNWGVPNKILETSFRLFKYPKIDWSDAVFSPHFNLIECGHIPRVMTFHDLSFVHHPDFFSLKQRFWHRFQNYEAQAAQASKIIAVSEYTKDDLINILKIPESKIEVVYSGIDKRFKVIDKASTELLEFKSRHKINYPFVLYLGTIEPRKNILGLIRAFNLIKAGERHRDLKLVLAGSLGWLNESILKEAKKSRFKDDIVFWGAVPHNERVYLYNLASVFAYPSFFEGFGFPPLEAQSSGVPVVAGDRASLPEILGNAALFVNPWKVQEIAESIIACLTNNAVREKLIKSGLENSAKFSWSAAAEKTLRVIEGAVGN